MTLQRIKAFAALMLMVAALAAAHIWRPTAHLADTRAKVELETMFPKAFGDWRVDERMPAQLIAPDTQAFLNKIYNQTLSRTYVNRQGDRIMLSVAYGGDQSDGTRAHRPEVCYPAQGFQIDSNQSSVMAVAGHNMRVRQLVSRLGARIEPITYWVTVGERISLSGTEQKLAQLSYTTRGVVPDGMLVRVSSIDVNAVSAYRLHQAFVAEMAIAVRAEHRSQVFGAAGA